MVTVLWLSYQVNHSFDYVLGNLTASCLSMAKLLYHLFRKSFASTFASFFHVMPGRTGYLGQALAAALGVAAAAAAAVLAVVVSVDVAVTDSVLRIEE